MLPPRETHRDCESILQDYRQSAGERGHRQGWPFTSTSTLSVIMSPQSKNSFNDSIDIEVNRILQARQHTLTLTYAQISNAHTSKTGTCTAGSEIKLGLRKNALGI